MVLYMILTILGLIAIGFIKKVMSLMKFSKDFDFLYDYNEKYVKYLNNYLGKRINSEEENKLYMELISKSPKAQRLLGNDGLISYKPAGASYMHNNYQVLINTVQALRNPALMSEEFSWVNNMLIMKMAIYEDIMSEIRGNMINPLILLSEGVQFFVTLPISLLYWTGLIEYSTLNRVSNYFIFKLLNFLIIIIGFLSAIVTLVTGWEPFIKIANKFM
ncbi:hypothetical protein F8163_09280 [Bacillus luti]|uniref:Uncharacterized protein n=2 Tax=Bacillus luti TaxID=2026191 RepID=A0A7V7S806_9BACI|nr:hypothetical protein F8163_09280 [Bacillus luti]